MCESLPDVPVTDRLYVPGTVGPVPPGNITVAPDPQPAINAPVPTTSVINAIVAAHLRARARIGNDCVRVQRYQPAIARIIVAKIASNNNCVGVLKLNHGWGRTTAVFAVVVTLKLTCAAVPGDTVTVLCGSVHTAPVGTPEQVSVTTIESELVDPPTASTSNANSALAPAVTVCVPVPPAGISSWKSSALPNKLMVCGLSPALSLTCRVPVRVPPEVGINVTLTVQFAAG